MDFPRFARFMDLLRHWWHMRQVPELPSEREPWEEPSLSEILIEIFRSDDD